MRDSTVSEFEWNPRFHFRQRKNLGSILDGFESRISVSETVPVLLALTDLSRLDGPFSKQTDHYRAIAETCNVRRV